MSVTEGEDTWHEVIDVKTRGAHADGVGVRDWMTGDAHCLLLEEEEAHSRYFAGEEVEEGLGEGEFGVDVGNDYGGRRGGEGGREGERETVGGETEAEERARGGKANTYTFPPSLPPSLPPLLIYHPYNKSPAP